MLQVTEILARMGLNKKEFSVLAEHLRSSLVSVTA